MTIIVSVSVQWVLPMVLGAGDPDALGEYPRGEGSGIARAAEPGARTPGENYLNIVYTSRCVRVILAQVPC